MVGSPLSVCKFRWQVLKFVLAACNATRALFARLQQRSALLKSISLLDCLLAAHAASVSTSESLAAAMGNAGGPEAQQVLQVCNFTHRHCHRLNQCMKVGVRGEGIWAIDCGSVLYAVQSNTCIICSTTIAHFRATLQG